MHELFITTCLSALCPELLPKLVATSSDWNAWLTEDAGEQLLAPIADAAYTRAIFFMTEQTLSLLTGVKPQSEIHFSRSTVFVFSTQVPRLRSTAPTANVG
jgi:hypothetical protein